MELYCRLANEFSKTKKKIFCFGNSFFFIHGKCMCEGVGEDSRHGVWHVNIRVGTCIILLECLCFLLHVHFRWGVALVGKLLY